MSTPTSLRRRLLVLAASTALLLTALALGLNACCNCGSGPEPAIALPEKARPMIGSWVGPDGAGLYLRADGTGALTASRDARPAAATVTFDDPTFSFHRDRFLDIATDVKVLKWPERSNGNDCALLSGGRTGFTGIFTRSTPLTAAQLKKYGGYWTAPGIDLWIRSDGYVTGNLQGDPVDGAIVFGKKGARIVTCVEGKKWKRLLIAAAGITVAGIALDRQDAGWEAALPEGEVPPSHSSSGHDWD